jgi:pyrroloquinoline quinone (PQQ) biosynthesis protein C
MQAFRRVGDLKEISSYPQWIQDIERSTRRAKMQVVGHDFFALLRDAELPLSALQRFLIGGWPTIEHFPRFMAMNLKKASHGHSPGEDMARRYLVHNIRVEQKHADHWIDWAASAGLTLEDLQAGSGAEGIKALAHWCWYVSDSASLAVGIAATNYAVEGATGEWSCVVCSRSTYAESLPAETRAAATRWLRLHAHYDDTHPWEALDIVATLLGNNPSAKQVAEVERAIRTSYAYIEMGLDQALGSVLHGGFDETASNASSLGDFDALSAA